MTRPSLEANLAAGGLTDSVRQELLPPGTDIDSLSRSHLDDRYPQEDSHSRIEVVLQSLQTRPLARHPNGQILAVCFGLTDFAYWLFVTDPGVDRRFERLGIGR